GQGDLHLALARGGQDVLDAGHRPMIPCESPAARIVHSAAKSPAQRSSSITPAASRRRAARPTSQGFQMSNRRKKTNAATQPGQGKRSDERPISQKPSEGAQSAIHWPTSSSMTISGRSG